jgi:hypothetical protein
VANRVSGSVSIYAVASCTSEIDITIGDNAQITQPGATLAYTVTLTNTVATTIA